MGIVPSSEPEVEDTDQVALRLMLSYVEAECLRIGATEAARHAALAAAAMPPPVPSDPVGPQAEAESLRRLAPRRPKGARLH